MTYLISSPCIGSKDGSCVEVCPVDCIIETTSMFAIDPNECIDWAACESVCPVSAIVSSRDLPAEFEGFLEINAAHVEGPAAVDCLVASVDGRRRAG